MVVETRILVSALTFYISFNPPLSKMVVETGDRTSTPLSQSCFQPTPIQDGC
ncbi:hypothetical protein [Scytonema hofmannii]|nr:hypothetical protein [Scytonema hofmannii]